MARSRMPVWANSTLYFNHQKRLSTTVIALIACAVIFSTFLFTGSSVGTGALFATEWPTATVVQQPTWLIGTMSPVKGVGRRAIIRSTWQSLYRNDTLFKTIFFLARPPSDWISLIEAENKTYGDLVVLDSIKETAEIANHIKVLEWFKWVVAQGHEWPFVTKADDDTFLDPIRFFDKYLEPLVVESKEKELPPIYIGRKLQHITEFDVAGGQMITVSGDALQHVARLYEENRFWDNEDVAVGRLLHEGHVATRFIHLENEFAFDYHDETDGSEIHGVKTAWAPHGANLTLDVHGVGPGAIVPHKMKTDDAYMRVAACFGPHGVLMNENDLEDIGKTANSTNETNSTNGTNEMNEEEVGDFETNSNPTRLT